MKKNPIIIIFGITVIVLLVFAISNSKNNAAGSVVGNTKTSITTTELLNPSYAVGNFYRVAKGFSSGKVYVQYTGADFCPFCAAERWSIVNALSRFGTFENLEQNTKSAFSRSSFSEIPTYGFAGVNYQSEYINFNSKEYADRNYQPLEKLTSEEEAVFNRYNPRGSIPLLLIGGGNGVFMQIGAGYSPSILYGKDFYTIKSDIENGEKTEITEEIINEADRITAMICINNNKQPQDVCSKDSVVEFMSQLEI